MSDPHYDTEALDAERGRYELSLGGRIYADIAPDLRARLELPGLRELLVDASHLEQIDSSGLGVFVDLLKRLRPQGGRIVFYGLGPDIRRVFDLTKLDRVMTVCETRTAALESLAP